MDASPDSQTPHRSLRLGGTVALTGFALLWAATGSSGLPGDLAVLVGLAVSAAVTAAVAVVGVRTPPPERSTPPSLPDDWYRRFTTVGVVQAAAVGVAVALLVAFGLPAALPAAVCLIVGLHFLPLASVFAQPVYRWTGVLLCGAAVAGGAVLALAGAAPSRAAVGFAAAAVLWGTALAVARR